MVIVRFVLLVSQPCAVTPVKASTNSQYLLAGAPCGPSYDSPTGSDGSMRRSRGTSPKEFSKNGHLLGECPYTIESAIKGT